MLADKLTGTPWLLAPRTTLSGSNQTAAFSAVLVDIWTAVLSPRPLGLYFILKVTWVQQAKADGHREYPALLTHRLICTQSPHQLTSEGTHPQAL